MGSDVTYPLKSLAVLITYLLLYKRLTYQNPVKQYYDGDFCEIIERLTIVSKVSITDV